MVLNAADVLKIGRKKKCPRLQIAANCLLFSPYFRWKWVVNGVLFVKYNYLFIGVRLAVEQIIYHRV